MAADGQAVPDADRAATLKRFRKAFGSAPPTDKSVSDIPTRGATDALLAA